MYGNDTIVTQLNAKALILAKINATTKFADVWTYLMTTGMRVSEIGKIMTSPIFNVVAQYAQTDIYDQRSKSANLENAIRFVLDEQTLYKSINSKFTTLLTYIGKDAFFDVSNSLLLQLSFELDKNGNIRYDGTTPMLKPNSLIERWWLSTQPSDFNGVYNANDILKDIQTVIAKKWNDDKFDFSEQYKSLVAAVYAELQSNPEAMNVLLNLLSDKIGDAITYTAIDPEMLLFADSSFLDDPDLFSEEYGEDIEEGVDEYYGELDTASARTFYRYVTMQLIPKMQKIGVMSEEERTTMKSLLDKVLPAMQEQQMNGQILGVNQGLKTKNYEEYSWVRKIENFVNQRYIKSDSLTQPVPFSLLRFLTDEAYQKQQIDQYEQVKSTVNILKSVLNTPHYKTMFEIVSTNRQMLERSAALRIERELADKVMAADKAKAKSTPTYDGVSTGYFFKLNQKEYKALQYVVSDALIFNFLRSLDGLELTVPVGQTYYAEGKPVKSKSGMQHIINFKSADEIASFKRLMDEYIIPELIRLYGSENQFFANLTTGFKRDTITGTPITFYKLSFNVSDVAKSTKLQNLYDGVARDFNAMLNTRVTFLNGDWTIGDLFYLYNLITHKEGIGGDSMTKLFDEMALSNNRYSLLNAYKTYLGRVDSGDLRWEESTADRNSSVVRFGDGFAIDLRDVRYRLCLSEDSEKKLRVKRKLDDKGRVVEMTMTDTKHKEKSALDKVPIAAINKSDYTFNLYFTSKQNVQISAKPVDIQENVRVAKMNSTEVLTAIIDNLKTKLGGKIPIHIIHTDELEQDDLPFKVEERMYNAIGFMINGHIYINPDNFKGDIIDIGAPVHELMHIVCAAMKYGNNSQKTLYYNLLKTINEGDARWEQFYKDMEDNYEGLTGSDLKEEVLVRALRKAFVDGFKDVWDSIHEESLRLHNIGSTVKTILEDLFAVDFEGTTEIETIMKAPLNQVLAVFNSHFMSYTDTRFAISTVIPTNQKLARLKRKMEKDKTLTIEGDC